MLLGVHAIWGSASAPTAEHQRRRPPTAGESAGKQDRQFIGAPLERFRHFSDLLLHLVASHARKIKPIPGPRHVPPKRRRSPSSSLRMRSRSGPAITQSAPDQTGRTRSSWLREPMPSLVKTFFRWYWTLRAPISACAALLAINLLAER
jgi:hypothetical protein